MRKVALLVLLLATAFAGQAYGQIIEQQSSDPQLAMGLGVVDAYDSFCPDTASTHKMLTHMSDVVSATVDFEVVSAKFAEVVAEATAMGEHNWCVQTSPYIHNLLNSAKKSTSTERSFIGDLGNAYERGREEHDLGRTAADNGRGSIDANTEARGLRPPAESRVVPAGGVYGSPNAK
jgi:hypothetical protein